MKSAPSSPFCVLVVDDDTEHLRAVCRLLEREGIATEPATDVATAISAWRRIQPAAVVTDLMLGRGSGLELLRSLLQLDPEASVVVMTAFGTVERAVEAMKAGARDFIVKPIERAALVQTVRRALDHARLRQENASLRAELDAFRRLPPLLGDDPAFRALLAQLRRAAALDTTVLLLGESGSGKEMFARELHAYSPRATGPFVAIDCGALPPSLVESELFGHEEGAFTGASRRRIGRIESARGGTLLLDEIGELPLDAQVKLLRVLQEREVVRVGATQPTAVDVRIVAATHRNLAEEVRAGRFRQDLFYRLNVLPLTIPPLRARGADVVLLAQHFATLLRPGSPPRFTAEALERLRVYSWPGNVRELRNVVERALVLDRDGRLDVDDLPPEVVSAVPNDEVLHIPIPMPLGDVERLVIEATLRHTSGDKAHAAALLGVGRRTIYRRVDEYRSVDGAPEQDAGTDDEDERLQR